ncbi:hypothetical protein XM56_10165 [Yersinia enterocolitica]|nr:hypothetical protein XM56_10165 [Yersinia enterocolitica]
MVYWERPYKARLEPPGMGLRRLYDLPVFAAAGTLSITSLNVAIANGVVTSELDDKPSNEPGV